MARRLPTAPDGGWGWLVVLASFTIQALTIGITYTFGVLFVELLDVFEAGESVTSWIGSIQPALLYLTGIVAGPLIRRYGWRAVTISGSIISAVGFATSSFSPNIYLLYFTYGGLTGIGNGLMYVTSMVAVQHYFEKKRAMATGLAVSGSGVGTLIFGIISRLMIDKWGWRWMLRVEAILILIGVICGMLYRPLLDESSIEESDEEARDADDERSSLMGSNRQEYGGTSTSGAQGVVKRQEAALARQREESEVGDTVCCSCCPNVISNYFRGDIFRNPIFYMICVSIIMFCFGYHVPYTYTPERAQKYGLDATQASFLISIMGIANVLSRLLFGWVGDKSPGIRFYLGAAVLTLGGVVSAFIFLFKTHVELIIYSVLFGSFTGCWASLYPVLLVDLLGIDNIEQTMGLCFAAGSGAFLVASPMSGMIISKTGSYDAPFEVVGSLEAFGGVVFFCIAFLRSSYGYNRVIRDEHGMQRKRYVSESFS